MNFKERIEDCEKTIKKCLIELKDKFESSTFCDTYDILDHINNSDDARDFVNNIDKQINEHIYLHQYLTYNNDVDKYLKEHDYLLSDSLTIAHELDIKPKNKYDLAMIHWRHFACLELIDLFQEILSTVHEYYDALEELEELKNVSNE